MRAVERLRYFNYLVVRIFRTKIYGSTHSSGAQVPGVFNGAKWYLFIFCRIGHELVMVYFNQKRNLMRILSGHDGQITKRSSHRVAAGLNSQLDDIFRVEVKRVFGKRCTRGMLNTLVDRQYRYITCTAQPAMIINS